MKKIYKYTLHAWPDIIQLPKDAKFLSVQTQRNEPQAWFLVDPKAETESRQFVCFATGEPIHLESQLNFLGTFQLEGGALVFHCFEIYETQP